MPWSIRDAYGHTKKANTTAKQTQWTRVANSVLESGGDEASAIRQANAVVAKTDSKPSKRKPKR